MGREWKGRVSKCKAVDIVKQLKKIKLMNTGHMKSPHFKIGIRMPYQTWKGGGISLKELMLDSLYFFREEKF